MIGICLAEHQFLLIICQNQNSTSLILGSNYLLWDRSSLFQQSHYPLDDQTIKLKFWAFPFLLYSSMTFHRKILETQDFHLDESLSSGVDYELYSRIFANVEVKNISQPLVVYTAFWMHDKNY